MKFKKILNRVGLGVVTTAIVIAGGAAFTAFEAHIVNVTASIENALTVPVERPGLNFGTVFPEEVLHQNLPISLSQSFLEEPRVDDVSYMIRQKPKCGVPIADTNPTQYSKFVQATDGPNGNFVCPLVPGIETAPVQSVKLPSLCQDLSKHELNGLGQPLEGGIDAPHGPGTDTEWMLVDSIATQVTGHLVKDTNVTDNWDIDLEVPPFRGQVAQDDTWDPKYYLDPATEHQLFGCDLWIEVTDISLPPKTGSLTVTKIVDNTGGGTKSVSDFPLFVDGNSVTSGVATNQSAGNHTVTETSDPNYNAVFGAGCDENGVVNVPDQAVVDCTITNTFVPTKGTLTVNKVLNNTGGGSASVTNFSFAVNGGSSTAFEADGSNSMTVAAGNYSVVEGAAAGYTTTYTNSLNANTNCDNLAVPVNGTVTCTITNTFQTAKITIHKTVSDPGQLGGQTASDFQMTLDGNNVDQDVATTVAAGTYTVGETDTHGDTVTYSGACSGTNQVTVSANDDVTCTVTNTIPFGTITVHKTITNNDGGTAVVGNFNFFVDSTTVSSDVAHNFAPGTYTVTESGVFGYQATFGGDCDSDTQQITIAAGQSKTCNITNDDIRPVITLIKNVVGGTAAATSFIMKVDGTPVPTGGSKSVTANANHSITEDAHAGYTFTSITGSGCPATLPGNVNLTPGQSITCTVTNTANP